MNKENTKLFDKFKEMSRLGNYVPVMVE